MVARRGISRTVVGAIAGAAIVGLGTVSAKAAPWLQIFIEQSTFYDTTEPDADTWAKIGTTGFRLWIVTDTGTPGHGALEDLMFVAVHNSATGPSPALTFTSTTIGNLTSSLPTSDFDPALYSYAGWTDTSTPAVVNGSPDNSGTGLHPILTPHSPWAEYGVNAAWFEWNLGDGTATDSNLADFAPAAGCTTAANFNYFGAGCTSPLPVPGDLKAQINVYDVTVAGLNPGDQVHFDVYGHYDAPPNGKDECESAGYFFSQGKCYVSASNRTLVGEVPNYIANANSHDARWEQGQRIVTPEPLTLGILGSGLLGLVALRRRRRG